MRGEKMPTLKISKNMNELLEKITKSENELSINNLVWKMFVEYTEKRGYWEGKGNNLQLNL